MSFEQFKSAILYMSFIAYEHCGPDLKPVNKVNTAALLISLPYHSIAMAGEGASAVHVESRERQ